MKRELTKSKEAQLRKEWIRYNKRRKESHQPPITFEKYVEWSFGMKSQTIIIPLVNRNKRKTRKLKARWTMEGSALDTPSWDGPGDSPPPSNGIVGPDEYAPKPPKQTYTGDLIKGIATMHKSNAVPVVVRQQATEVAEMRRN